MSLIASKTATKKRKGEKGGPVRAAKRSRIGNGYHSSSSDDEKSEDETFTGTKKSQTTQSFKAQNSKATKEELEDDVSDNLESSVSDPDDELDDTDLDEGNRKTTTSKRNDPSAFASSISAILSSKLNADKRVDPVLARSTSAREANSALADSKLEARARRKLRDEKRHELERGRIKDVLLGAKVSKEGSDEPMASAQSIREEEIRLRKTAQRGVIKLFNAIRQAQIKADEARKKGGTSSQQKERATEMSKKGFLEMVAAGGQKSSRSKEQMESKTIEEA